MDTQVYQVLNDSAEEILDFESAKIQDDLPLDDCLILIFLGRYALNEIQFNQSGSYHSAR